MSAIPLTLPHGFGFVGAALVSTVFLTMGQGFIVAGKRKAANIKYPQAYATPEQEKESKAALIFNCAQRAHQNTLEVMPNVIISTVIAGLRYPIPAAIACGAFVFGRIFYTRGYITGDPEKRVSAIYGIGALGMMANILTSAYVAGTWVLASL